MISVTRANPLPILSNLSQAREHSSGWLLLLMALVASAMAHAKYAVNTKAASAK
jgi:hypothetical protein